MVGMILADGRFGWLVCWLVEVVVDYLVGGLAEMVDGLALIGGWWVGWLKLWMHWYGTIGWLDACGYWAGTG